MVQFLSCVVESKLKNENLHNNILYLYINTLFHFFPSFHSRLTNLPITEPIVFSHFNIITYINKYGQVSMRLKSRGE